MFVDEIHRLNRQVEEVLYPATVSYTHLGYYDRYFERHPRLLKVGIAYEFQIVDHIPTEVTDIPLQWIVTPDRTIKTTKS